MLVRETPLALQRMRTMFPGHCMRLIDDENRCYLKIAHDGDHKPFASNSHKMKLFSDLNGKELEVGFCE